MNIISKKNIFIIIALTLSLISTHAQPGGGGGFSAVGFHSQVIDGFDCLTDNRKIEMFFVNASMNMLDNEKTHQNQSLIKNNPRDSCSCEEINYNRYKKNQIYYLDDKKFTGFCWTKNNDRYYDRKPSEINFFKKGIHVNSIGYYPSGKKSSESYYTKSPKKITWYNNGIKKSKSTITLIGKYTKTVTWYENGKKKSKSKLKKIYVDDWGQTIGTIIKWDEDGKRTKTIRKKSNIRLH